MMAQPPPHKKFGPYVYDTSTDNNSLIFDTQTDSELTVLRERLPFDPASFYPTKPNPAQPMGEPKACPTLVLSPITNPLREILPLVRRRPAPGQGRDLSCHRRLQCCAYQRPDVATGQASVADDLMSSCNVSDGPPRRPSYHAGELPSTTHLSSQSVSKYTCV